MPQKAAVLATYALGLATITASHPLAAPDSAAATTSAAAPISTVTHLSHLHHHHHHHHNNETAATVTATATGLTTTQTADVALSDRADNHDRTASSDGAIRKRDDGKGSMCWGQWIQDGVSCPSCTVM